ncbi:hypothetical protein [Dongia sp.]|uniref:hypothetical protein n=1 Tax=Dongia sp. TaxID=1977262 RepID=UPI0037512CE9
MANLKQRTQQMPALTPVEDTRRDAEAKRDAKAGIGIPLDEAFAWLHDKVDGIERPKPKARKL